MPTALAWFTALSPTRAGLSVHCAELLPALAARFAIDVFVEAPRPADAAAAGACDAHDFVWKHARRPYDLIVYQLDSTCCHDYLWAYVCRYPGLLVLHDGQFHRARARALLPDGRAGDYRAEFACNHPRAPQAVAELGTRRLLGSLVQLWPMRQPLLDASRATIVHDAWLAEQVRREAPGLPVERLDFGVRHRPPDRGARARWRRRLGVPDGAMLVAAFGRLALDAGLPRTLRALAAARGAPPWRLALCGDPAAWRAAREEAGRLGLGRQVALPGPVALDALPAYLAAADVCICLRWPSPRETRAAWLRCLAAGKPTIAGDLVMAADAPALDPHDWTTVGDPPAAPAGVRIDVLAEDRSLAPAVARLVADAALRAELGAAARRLWQARFTIERLADGYARVIDSARLAPFDDRRRRLPAHLRSDGTERLQATLAALGLPAQDVFKP